MKIYTQNIAIVTFIASIISIGLGFYKMMVYRSADDASYDESTINSYVGGDAYNYIINGTHATSFFVLGGSLLIAGLVMLVIHQLQLIRLDSQAVEDPINGSKFTAALNEASEKSE